jgi:hypothetical protein
MHHSNRRSIPVLNMFMILAHADAGSGSADDAIVGLLVAILVIVGLWRVFTKAGKPGWAALIPIYNLIVCSKSRANRHGGSCYSSFLAST